MALKAVRCSMMKLMVLVTTASVFIVEASVLKNNFYKESCPIAEEIVTKVVERHLARDPTLAPALLRMHFHDCFVRGCDASVLLKGREGNKAERDAVPNKSLRGFEVIDDAKKELEKECPKVVSCSDVLALAARDAVSKGANGPSWIVRTGRRDGTVSSMTEALQNIPSPLMNVTQLKASFGGKGLSVKDMVVLSGGHSVGVSHCTSVNQRIFNFTGVVGTSDPAMDEHYVKRLKTKCNLNGNPKSTVAMDPVTPMSLDSSYYRLVMQRRVVFQSDSTLMSDPSTAKMVSKQLHQPHFLRNFAHSMTRMSEISVLTGSQGSIRTRCDLVPS